MNTQLNTQQLDQDELLLIEYDSAQFNVFNPEQLSNDSPELDSEAEFGDTVSVKKVKNIAGQKMEVAKLQYELELAVKELDTLNRNLSRMDDKSEEYYQAMESIADFLDEKIISKAQSKLTELEKVLEYTWNQRKPIKSVS